MVAENSKILTVSYGTFSCTLEGFDDPFSTMRGIAEYFRDLAADDRYFGAEPPTPDVEMLQRIAEKEVHNRVEKKLSDGGVVLRQVAVDPDEADAPVAPAVLNDAGEASTAPFPSGDASSDSIAESVDAVEETTAEVDVENVSVAREDDADEGNVLFEDVSEDPATEDEAFQDDDDDSALIDTVLAGTQSDADDELSENGGWNEEDTSSVADEEVASEEPVAQDDEDDAFDASQDGDDIIGEDSAEVDDAPAIQTGRVVSTPLEIFTERLETITAEAEPKQDDTPDFEDAIEAAEVEVEETVAPDTSFEDKLARIQAAVAATPDLDDDYDAEPEVASVDAPVDVAIATHNIDDDFQDDPFEDEVAEDEETPIPDGYSVAAEIVTLKRDDLVVDEDQAAEPDVMDADDMDADDETDSATDSASEIREAMGDTSLSDEDEDDLAATLARIEDVEAAPATPQDNEARAERTRPISRPLDARDEDEGVSRLLEEADHQFQDDESSRRRSAIAHLKAAVAATKADDLIRAFTGRDQSDEKETSAYRDDLNRVVKPQSSEDLAARSNDDTPDLETDETDTQEDASEATPTARPNAIEDQPAPLMLVSEQRVDGDDPSVDGASIRPKRIMSDDETEGFAPKETGFVAFAEDMGAKELPELLEAAAAYAAFVENEPHFSRPQLMRRVERSHLAEDFSREAGLRTFGQLLRQGRLQKLKRGQFTVSSDSRFNPESRIAGE